jgi:hypothetical protein
MPTMEEVLIAARRKLLAASGFAALIGTDVGKDSLEPGKYSGAFEDGWVFRGVDVANKPERDPSATGTSTVSIAMRDRWGGPNQHNTLRFPQLQFTILSDMARPTADNGLIGQRDAELRCDRVASAIIKEFNDVGNMNHWWTSTTYIVSCLLYQDLIIRDVPDMDGLVRGELRFSLELG